MDRRFAKYLSRVDLVKNQIERERLKEQESAAAKRRRTQQQNKQRFEHQQQLLRAELAARMAASVASGGDSASSVDPDAQAFITAASITDPTQQSAINQLVVDLKGYGVWTKMKALYPFVGGTASSHKFNLKDPRDLDAAFRLVFNGGGTHSSTGWLPNGTNAFADTKLIPSTNFTTYNHHIAIYSRTNSQRDSWNGAYMNSGQAERFILRSTDAPSGAFYYWSYGWAASSIFTANTDSRGLFLVTNRSASDREAYRNGITLATNTFNMSAYSPVNISLFIGSNNVNGSPSTYDNKEIAFGSLGDGLTDTEAANFYTAVQTFQTALNRQV